MVDFVHQTVDHELDSAITRKVSRISFRPRGPVRVDVLAMAALRYNYTHTYTDYHHYEMTAIEL